MRLWTVHPSYLDARGLVALWREALLARAVLAGRTRGYQHHPQLCRFRDAPDPEGAINAYLQAVYAESTRRGYCFDAGKLGPVRTVVPIIATHGQLDVEWRHLTAKLRRRSPATFRAVRSVTRPRAHPLFRVRPGAVAAWERAPARNSRTR
jgi:hypothetical protein